MPDSDFQDGTFVQDFKGEGLTVAEHFKATMADTEFIDNNN
jgi:hypothetical protein